MWLSSNNSICLRSCWILYLKLSQIPKLSQNVCFVVVLNENTIFDLLIAVFGINLEYILRKNWIETILIWWKFIPIWWMNIAQFHIISQWFLKNIHFHRTSWDVNLVHWNLRYHFSQRYISLHFVKTISFFEKKMKRSSLEFIYLTLL